MVINLPDFYQSEEWNEVLTFTNGLNYLLSDSDDEKLIIEILKGELVSILHGMFEDDIKNGVDYIISDWKKPLIIEYLSLHVRILIDTPQSYILSYLDKRKEELKWRIINEK